MSNITVTLPDPGEGYEWEKGLRSCDDEVLFIRVKKDNEFDWSKVGPNVLVSTNIRSACPKSDTPKPRRLVTGIWQAHIGGDPCPVHAEATIVEYRRNGQTFGPSKASNIGWDIDTVYRVTGRAHGYKYP